jgi:hypothetical protein
MSDAEMIAGGDGAAGNLSLLDKQGTRRVLVTAGPPRRAGSAGIRQGGASVEAGPTSQPANHPNPFGSSDPLPGGALAGAWVPPVESLTLDGQHAAVIVGGKDAAGRCYVTNEKGVPTITLSGITADVTVGTSAIGGHLGVVGKGGSPGIRLDGGAASLTVGQEGSRGSVAVIGVSGVPIVTLDNGDIHVGAKNHPGDVFVYDRDGNVAVHIDGEKGDVTLGNADCAEDFDVAAARRVEPGTVVVLDDDGAVGACAAAYDGRVAGVVSGAGAHRPALVLDRRPSATPRQPIALMGKVYCKVDARFGAVRTGDLLTTSPTVGHAMKASDRSLAFGAVVGKALRALDEGCALIPILVMLQ